MKFLKQLSSFNLLSDHQYGFRKWWSTGDLAFLTDSWLSSLNRSGETFAVALDISKAFDRLWHKALVSKLPSYELYPALCSFLSSFLSGRSVAAVVDGHCSTSKPIKSGVPQESVLPPTLFLLVINDLLFHDTLSYPLLCWRHHSALLHVLWQMTKSKGTANIKEWCFRKTDLRPCYHFRLGQEKLSFLQCL